MFESNPNGAAACAIQARADARRGQVKNNTRAGSARREPIPEHRAGAGSGAGGASVDEQWTLEVDHEARRAVEQRKGALRIGGGEPDFRSRSARRIEGGDRNPCAFRGCRGSRDAERSGRKDRRKNARSQECWHVLRRFNDLLMSRARLRKS
jgi:hypothetical protein